MSTALSISVRMNALIERIEQVKVFEDHWRLIGESLTRLRHGLNETVRKKDGSRAEEKILHTIATIEQVAASCCDDGSASNEVIYRELESVLFRLQLHLAQHQANLTDDYQVKVNLLSDTYHEQQSLIEKIHDAKMRQRLEEIEQRTNENTNDQLAQSRTKHGKTIESYIRCCIELHKSVLVSGLNGEVVGRVANKLYGISPETRIDLEHKWQGYHLPLTRTFIQLKPINSTSFERSESQRLLIGSDVNIFHDLDSKRQETKDLWQRLVSAPYMLSMLEQDRYVRNEEEEKDEDGKNISEENVVREKRWIVILGDPGSGKTSFARWLVRHHAEKILSDEHHSADNTPVRIPILIRVGEFAELLSEESSSTLFDYIGKHTWMGKCILDDQSISLDNLSSALQDSIKQGQALIILDGLDELPVSDQRSHVINAVENFVETYVQTPTSRSVFDNLHLSKCSDDPSRSGGNQIIITSRIEGYHAAPLAGQFDHYLIRPMDVEHMIDFIDYWFNHVHQQIINVLSLEKDNQGKIHAEVLKKELQNEENVDRLDMASNCCLISFICSVAFSQSDDSSLPTRRIEFYQDIIDSMLNSWIIKGSAVSISKLIRILSDVAIDIHRNSASGLIDENTLKEICIQSIKTLLNNQAYTGEDRREIENQAIEFVRVVREDVGLFTARGESLYGFLRLTFQEYFTSLKLTNVDQLKQEKLTVQESCSDDKVHIVTQSLHRHVNDPRFRVPIALALGRISSCWSPTEFDDFCLEFIRVEDESEPLLPVGAFMLISCADDLVHYPSNNVLFHALDLLIVAAGQHRWSVCCSFLFDRITTALRKLRNNIASLWINNLLSRSPPYSIETISALCYLIEGKPGEFENIHWLDQASCSMLQSFSTLDNESNQYAIDRLLIKISFFDHHLLSVHGNTLKEFFIVQKIDLHSITIFLLPLIIHLYGGLTRTDQSIVFDPLRIHRESTAVTLILKRFLSRKDLDQNDQNLNSLEDEFLEALLARLQANDQSSETVDLCIATICLGGINLLRKNEKITVNVVFNMAISRFKYVSMILRQLYFANNEQDRSIENQTTTFISRLIGEHQLDQLSKEFFVNLLDSLRSGMARLRSSETSILLEGEAAPDKRVTLNLPASLRKASGFFQHLLSPDIQLDRGRNSCSLLHHFTKLFWILEHDDVFDTPYRVAVAMDDIQQYLLFHNDEDLLFPLIFVPQHLQNLYFRLLKQDLIMINSKGLTLNGREQFCFGHILVECLMTLSNASCKRLSLLSALIALLPMLRMHQLENFGSSLLWTLARKDSYILQGFETSRKYPMDYKSGLYLNRSENFPLGDQMSDREQRILIKECIKQEQQRLRNALIDTDGIGTKLYSACVSLAHICRWTEEEKKSHLFEESIRGAMSIDSKLMRLDALIVILIYSHSDYQQIEVSNGRSLQKEIEHQFNEIFSDLPVLLHTAIFLRCLPLLQRQESIENCRKNLLSKLNNADQQDQQVAYEALSPYLQSNPSIIPLKQDKLNGVTEQNGVDDNRAMSSRSSVLRECFTVAPYKDVLTKSLSLSLLLSNMYLMELSSEVNQCMGINDHFLPASNPGASKRDESIIVMKLFQLKTPILTVGQASIITDMLSSNLPPNRRKSSKKYLIILNDELHCLNAVEFKACRLIECWMKWKGSSELSVFAFHAALLLAQSDFWSAEVAAIVCDLLCCDDDRFRQKAEITLRSKSDHDGRTSSKLGIDVLLTLTKKIAHFQHTSAFAKLNLSHMFNHITIDIQSHLETFLWFERYRMYALAAKKSSSKKLDASPISQFLSYFPSDITMGLSFCGQLRNISGDLLQLVCDLIKSNFSSFLDINGDVTSKLVLESHIRFVASILVSSATLSAYDDDDMRSLRVEALTTLLEASSNNTIRHAAAYALGYILDPETYKTLFKKLELLASQLTDDVSNDSDYLISSLISSYCHCIAVSEIDFDQDDIDLFRQLLERPSEMTSKAVHVGLARVLKDKSMLFEMLGSDHVQCYHALIGSTAYFFAYNVQQRCAANVVEFIEENPYLLSIFVAELYNSIRHFTKDVVYRESTDNILAYGYPQYVEVASLISVRMPAAFISCIKDCGYEDDLKRALFYTSKQHDFPRRNASLTVLSVFGELTVELCEMFIESLCHDSQSQNNCYKCLMRINSIKGEKTVQNLLVSYLKSKSMNVRYAATKMLLHFSQSSLIPSDQVRSALNELMSDPTSEEDLWLIEEPKDLLSECSYYYTGPLKRVIYSLLVQHLTGDTRHPMQRNELSDIDLNFVQSEKASRVASCLYEEKSSEPSSSVDVEKRLIDEEQESDNPMQLFQNGEEPIQKVTTNSETKEKREDVIIPSALVDVSIHPSHTPITVPISAKKKSTMCVII